MNFIAVIDEITLISPMFLPKRIVNVVNDMLLNIVFILLQQQKTSLTETVASVVAGSRTVAAVGSCLTTGTPRSASTGSSPTGTYHTIKSPIMVNTISILNHQSYSSHFN